MSKELFVTLVDYVPRDPVVLKPGYVFTFGKYKGKTVEEVIKEAHWYIKWLTKQGIAAIGDETLLNLFWEAKESAREASDIPF